MYLLPILCFLDEDVPLPIKPKEEKQPKKTEKEKKQRIKELEQLRQSMIYSTSHLHFFWQHETMISHVRKQVYDLWDMIGNDYNLLLLLQITGRQNKSE